jgi:23S rRNA U2552 (ribose-2'-O)-methylase RlmE/FtsJ
VSTLDLNREELNQFPGFYNRIKFFQDPEYEEFRKYKLEEAFNYVKYFKPKASRGESSEGYWICQGFHLGRGD